MRTFLPHDLKRQGSYDKLKGLNTLYALSWREQVGLSCKGCRNRVRMSASLSIHRSAGEAVKVGSWPIPALDPRPECAESGQSCNFGPATEAFHGRPSRCGKLPNDCDG